MKEHNIDSIVADINRLRSVFSNSKSLAAVKSFLENNTIEHVTDQADNGITIGCSIKKADRCCSTIQSIEQGMVEKSIIKVLGERISAVHPTQKPVSLLERLLNLVTSPGDIVLDPFAGSCSTAIACLNTDRSYICYEIDEEYYLSGMSRIIEHIT